LVDTPAVFARAANKGLAGYGTWKKYGRWEIRDTEIRGIVDTRCRPKGSGAEKTDSAGLAGLAESGAKDHNPC